MKKDIMLVTKKELRSFFASPIAYIVISIFLVICGYFYAAPLFVLNRLTIRHFIELVPLFFLFFIPAITMRSFSEEYRVGTIEILSTLPLKEYTVLIGKYLACLILIFVTLCITFIYPLSLCLFGKFDIGNTITMYLGLLLMGGMFTSVGIFSSSLTKNQIVAFVISFAICFVFFVIGKIGMLVPPYMSTIIDFIGIDSHFDNALRGIVDTRDIIYYISITTLFLFFAYNVLLTKK